VPTTRALISRIDLLANKCGVIFNYSWKDDLRRVYVRGSRDAVAFVSRARWISVTFTLLLEDMAPFKATLDKALGELQTTYHVTTSESLSLGIAEIKVKAYTA